MRRMLHTPPFATSDQIHLVQPFVHRITERTIEIAIQNSPYLDHAVDSPMNPADPQNLRVNMVPMRASKIHYPLMGSRGSRQ